MIEFLAVQSYPEVVITIIASIVLGLILAVSISCFTSKNDYSTQNYQKKITSHSKVEKTTMVESPKPVQVVKESTKEIEKVESTSSKSDLFDVTDFYPFSEGFHEASDCPCWDGHCCSMGPFACPNNVPFTKCMVFKKTKLQSHYEGIAVADPTRSVSFHLDV